MFTFIGFLETLCSLLLWISKSNMFKFWLGFLFWNPIIVDFGYEMKKGKTNLSGPNQKCCGNIIEEVWRKQPVFQLSFGEFINKSARCCDFDERQAFKRNVKVKELLQFVHHILWTFRKHTSKSWRVDFFLRRIIHSNQQQQKTFCPFLDIKKRIKFRLNKIGLTWNALDGNKQKKVYNVNYWCAVCALAPIKMCPFFIHSCWIFD